MPDLRRVGFIHVALISSGCAPLGGSGPHASVSLPLSQAWMDGRKVEYITSDISDPAMAQALGVNLVPRLAQALPAPGRPSVVTNIVVNCPITRSVDGQAIRGAQ